MLPSLQFALRHPWVRAAGFVSVLLTLVSLLLWATYWWPVRQEVHGLVERINEVRSDTVHAMQAADVLRAYQKVKQQVEQLDVKLGAQSPQATLVPALSALAKKCNARILSQAYEEGKVEGDYVPLYLDLSIQASYADLRRFILGLAQLPTWTLVQEARLTQVDSKTKAHFRLVTYRKAKPA